VGTGKREEDSCDPAILWLPVRGWIEAPGSQFDFDPLWLTGTRHPACHEYYRSTRVSYLAIGIPGATAASIESSPGSFHLRENALMVHPFAAQRMSQFFFKILIKKAKTNLKSV
jgi:hypothetical protein